jgi:hypothetical protein
MGLADYFRRSAIAAAQVLSGFDEVAISERLERTSVEINLNDTESAESRSLVDLSVRLLARFYPRLGFSGPAAAVSEQVELARAINPNIDIVTGKCDFGIGIGSSARPESADSVFVGSNGWDAYLSFDGPQEVGESRNPFGPGAAACLAVGETFRKVFAIGEPQSTGVILSTLDLASQPSKNNFTFDGTDIGSAVLVGVGAIGNAAVWALGRAPAIGQLHLVDDQRTELSNLQRYVLSSRPDDDASKVELAMQFLQVGIRGVAHPQRWENFVAKHGYLWNQVLVALDSAQGRRNVQASLPEWIANSWTQPGDLGISVHPWSQSGACLSCMYIPNGPVPGEDRVIGSALGLTSDLELLNIRRLLHACSPLPPELYGQVSAHLGIEPGDLAAFSDRPLRALYVEGLCGGAVLPLNRIGRPNQDVHVPIAHQSALAGVLLGARLVARAIGQVPDTTEVTRIDVLRPLAAYLTQPMQKDARGICICQDKVYQDTWRAKYEVTSDS